MKTLHAPSAILRLDRKKGSKAVYRCDGRVQLSPGRSKRVTADGHSKAEAKDNWLRKAKSAQMGVAHPGVSAAAYFSIWLNKKRGQVLNSTVDRYEMDINMHLKPFFNGRLLADIRRSDIEELVTKLIGEGYRSLTARHVVATISSILSSAVADDIIPKNSAIRITIARDARPHTRDMVHPMEMLTLLETQSSSQALELLKLLTVIPLRLNEVRGLMLSDFSDDYTQVHIKESATRDMRPERKALKTKSGVRTLDLPAPARAIVVRAAKRHVDEGLTSGWVFDQGDGYPPSEGHLRYYFTQLKLRAGLPKGLRIHDLRAGMATFLAKSRESVATVQLALGHSDPLVTMRYYTFSDSEQVTAALGKVWTSWTPAASPSGTDEQLPPKSPPNAENGVDEETIPNLGKVAFRAGRSGGERGIRTLDGVAPKPHFQCGAIDH